MAIDRSTVITGPAVVTYGGQTFHTKGDIDVGVNRETFEVVTGVHGKIDERNADFEAEISFDPAGEWEALNVLFPHGTSDFGASIFGSSDSPLVIKSVDGKTYTFHAAAVTQIPQIRASAVETLIGQVTFGAIRKNNTAWSAADSFLTIASATFSDTTMDPSNIITQPYSAAWGSSPWDSFETEDGFTIDFDLSLDDIRTDSDGIIDKRFGGLAVNARCVPLGVTDAQILTAMRMQGSGAARGGSLNTNSNDLVVSGTGVTITVKNAQMKTAGYRYGATVIRNGEVAFVATRGFTAGVADPLFTVGT